MNCFQGMQSIQSFNIWTISNLLHVSRLKVTKSLEEIPDSPEYQWHYNKWSFIEIKYNCFEHLFRVFSFLVPSLPSCKIQGLVVFHKNGMASWKFQSWESIFLLVASALCCCMKISNQYSLSIVYLESTLVCATWHEEGSIAQDRCTLMLVKNQREQDEIVLEIALKLKYPTVALSCLVHG